MMYDLFLNSLRMSKKPKLFLKTWCKLSIAHYCRDVRVVGHLASGSMCNANLSFCYNSFYQAKCVTNLGKKKPHYEIVVVKNKV